LEQHTLRNRYFWNQNFQLAGWNFKVDFQVSWDFGYHKNQTMLTPGILRMLLRFPKTDGRPWADKLKSNLRTFASGRFRMVKLLLVAGANCQHRRYAVEARIENKWQRGMAAHSLIVPFILF